MEGSEYLQGGNGRLWILWVHMIWVGPGIITLDSACTSKKKILNLFFMLGIVLQIVLNCQQINSMFYYLMFALACFSSALVFFFFFGGAIFIIA
jgi:hypothetical protein